MYLATILQQLNYIDHYNENMHFNVMQYYINKYLQIIRNIHRQADRTASEKLRKKTDQLGRRKWNTH